MKELTAADLRVGNLVDIGGTHTIIESINNSLLCIKSDNNEYEDYYGYWVSTDLCEGEKIQDIKPIPLTEEWLLRFGFEFDIFYQKHTNGKICIYWCNKICLFSWCKSHREDILRYEYPEYVHQLQNLYFALTGEELILTDAT